MNKAFINRICARFGFEINGLSYMQALRRSAVTPDALLQQKQLLKGKANTIFDLGANYGSVTIEYKKIFPDASVYAFEPFPDIFKSLKETMSVMKGVYVFDKAVADKTGTRTFYVNENADTNSLFKSQETGMSSDQMARNKSSIEVKTISLDEFCEEKNIQFIDILKMDIQGGELDALKGAAKLLREKKIGLIYAEAFFIPQYAQQPLIQDLMVYLDSVGYQLQDIYNPFYGKGSLAWCDAIFLPRK